ncbi:MAG: hypothetical protein HZT40_18015 [Candidatus Thiothrix singaporensis]|uniref:Uncharacterized protein n=1 Tax=Candidatus Thiothrix singaporensis TaxID=2799669 RepID=A0A7L6AVM6_9GAMM|nr:MAG: hypothetical protein HZT40_18015 [Candidatus Thiothrix singaporensis]
MEELKLMCLLVLEFNTNSGAGCGECVAVTIFAVGRVNFSFTEWAGFKKMFARGISLKGVKPPMASLPTVYPWANEELFNAGLCQRYLPSPKASRQDTPFGQYYPFHFTQTIT